MHATENLAEADRLMTVCNSCRYCEGLCAVFPAMELRRAFTDADLNYLANLCHNCGACYVDCQFSPPHEFKVNVPHTLAKVRADSYKSYAWPKALQPLFDRNGLAIAIIAALSIAGFILGFALRHDPSVLFGTSASFYRLMPHNVLVAIFLAISTLALVALVMGFRNFWKDIGASRIAGEDSPSLWQAIKDTATLRYLDGGGVGCNNEDERPNDRRRLFHHVTFYGFLLCFAATSAGTVLHYLFNDPAPYGWLEIPKLFGIPGGIGLSIGAAGLLLQKLKRDPALIDAPRLGMDTAFIAMMGLTGFTGLVLMLVRPTPAMGIALALHLGVVFALFLTMPYGKFVHGLYRFGALLLYGIERRTQRPTTS